MASTKSKTAATRAPKTKAAATADDNVLPIGTTGTTLREARQARGIEIEAVADELMIRRFYLEALENNSFKDMPERVYATGFVRNYAQYLGLDVAEITQQFIREAYGSRNAGFKVDLAMPEPIVHSIVPGRTAMIAAVAVLAVLIAGLVLATRDGDTDTVVVAPPVAGTMDTQATNTQTNTATETVAPVVAPQTADALTPPEADVAPKANETRAFVSATSSNTTTTESAPSPEAGTDAPVMTDKKAVLPTDSVAAALPEKTPVVVGNESGDNAAATPAAAPAARIMLQATQSSWLEVKDSGGKILFTSILKAGQLLPLPEQKGLTITTGNAGGLRLVVDGATQNPLGQANEVKRNLSVDRLLPKTEN